MWKDGFGGYVTSRSGRSMQTFVEFHGGDLVEGYKRDASYCYHSRAIPSKSLRCTQSSHFFRRTSQKSVRRRGMATISINGKMGLCNVSAGTSTLKGTFLFFVSWVVTQSTSRFSVCARRWFGPVGSL